MRNTIILGTYSKAGRVEVTIELRAKEKGEELSISGSVWRKDRRDIIAGGQLQESLLTYLDQPLPHVTPEKLARLIEVWQRWHLNDMRAGCEHQREWDTTRQVEVHWYGLTTEAYTLRNSTRKALADAALRGEILNLTPTARALAGLDTWYKEVPTPPDASGPFSGCYEVKRRETKALGWLRPDEHPEGMLGKPCDVCGYKYGTSWLFESLPAEVRAEVVRWIETGTL